MSAIDNQNQKNDLDTENQASSINLKKALTDFNGQNLYEEVADKNLLNDWMRLINSRWNLVITHFKSTSDQIRTMELEIKKIEQQIDSLEKQILSNLHKQNKYRANARDCLYHEFQKRRETLGLPDLDVHVDGFMEHSKQESSGIINFDNSVPSRTQKVLLNVKILSTLD